MSHLTPVLFIGHGSPMNIIENNAWTRNWRALGETLTDIAGVVMLSAHWYTEGTKVTKEPQPKMIYDMRGFPKEIYDYIYPAVNDLNIRDATANVLPMAQLSDQWGYDHGNYGVLCHLLPQADIPVLQVSIDAHQKSAAHYALGERLKALRSQKILIIGSGNIVHNLYKIGQVQSRSWVKDFDDQVVELTKQHDIGGILALEATHPDFHLAAPTPDHFYPFLSALGATDATDDLEIFNQDIALETLTMTSFVWRSTK
ncbi:class III extradiol ring-cleavage dioxygenase [Wohlfahrtiimonas chitiniclastica]|uniref:DODA-type extradiol aromatic ring-opening family dioxygenase n=1 Tax=Wohlfahrtiimonas chitiniclastica TaxID=400946 RepID=UPI0007B3FF87|nr:class III extradiol ring-cleavage dioxygenase [Wohlfahrtiimonas chitiniclastica]WHR55335.1 class III extradiol ring-cleavage dioxygenase [Wohlfahrtiimonas chitiniclastica]